MYYPIGWKKVLNLDIDYGHSSIRDIQTNHERELFFILTTNSIHIWHVRPSVEIVCHKRSQQSIDSLGANKIATWKTDSSVIVVATEQDQLLFYYLKTRESTGPNSKFLLTSSSGSGIYRLEENPCSLKSILNCDQELIDKTITSTYIPALTIFSFGKLDLSTIGVSCLMAAEEELIVGARNGEIYGVFWNGNVDVKFPWSITRDGANKERICLSDLRFSSVLNGFALVFSDGQVGFMSTRKRSDITANGTSDKTKHSETCNSSVNLLTCFKEASCIEVNHKYRLVAIGHKNSKVSVCNLEDTSLTLVINHELELQPNKVPYHTTNLGGIKCMKYSPDSFALMTCWEAGEFALWSVFGTLLFCSQQWRAESQSNPLTKPLSISSLCWGREGYNVWMVTTHNEHETQDLFRDSAGRESYTEDNLESSLGSTLPNYSEEVIVISFAHSNLNSNPHLTCTSDSIVLCSEDRLYVGPGVPNGAKFDHWFIIDIPQHYLSFNYPIRYATVDRECRNAVIVGNKGFAVYSIESSKWKFFSKTSSDNTFSVFGDIIWWKDYLIASVVNLETEKFELRAYLIGETLDSEHYIVQTIPREVIRMSVFENRLLVLYEDGTLGMFMLNSRMRKLKSKKHNLIRRSSSIVSGASSLDSEDASNQSRKQSTQESISNVKITTLNHSRDLFLQISPIENLVISNLQANPYCISSIALTCLHFKNNRLDDSIILNACGKLFLLERQAPPELGKQTLTSNSSSNDLFDSTLDNAVTNDLENQVRSLKLTNSIHLASASLRDTTEHSALSNVAFKAVSVIATNVEQYWISPEINCASDMSYFRKSLWLYCGGANNYLQVWLPLLNDKSDPPNDLYVPDRIMLPIKCDIYPLAIRSSAPDVAGPDDAIVLGAESEIIHKDGSLFTDIPYSTVKRQCRVYLHRILRELLLNQHLGYYARKIAESCQTLPYFAHCFELLLHEVLEEEATSPVPLPDPMLPQVVKFIKEFPVYLETIVHCARKSELSMWSHLFDERAVGNPRRLFKQCMEKHKLDTAASCLIILQSLDRNIVSHRMVKELIKAAREDIKYNYLVEDLENFLSRAEIDYMSNSGSGSPET